MTNVPPHGRLGRLQEGRGDLHRHDAGRGGGLEATIEADYPLVDPVKKSFDYMQRLVLEACHVESWRHFFNKKLNNYFVLLRTGPTELQD